MFELPDRITKEFLDNLEWRPGPLDTYEITEIGLLRRQDNVDIRGVYPGFLYSTNIAMRRAPHYRLNPRLYVLEKVHTQATNCQVHAHSHF